MPVIPTHTYPGVYIQEVPSSVRTIVGVSTSITAFVGRTARGPVNEPMALTSYADFDRLFGGIWAQSELGYAVRDFYLNGGNQALIVRLFHPSAAPAPAAPQAATSSSSAATPSSSSGSTSASGGQSSTSSSSSASTSASSSQASAAPLTNARLNVNGLPLEARDPGSWGNFLRARIDPPDVRSDADAQQLYGLAKKDLFNLSIFDTQTNTLEVFRNVSVAPGSQQVDTVLALGSHLVQVPDGAARPLTLPTPHTTVPPRGQSIWNTDGASTGVAAADSATDGENLVSDDFIGDGLQAKKAGLYALEHADLFNLLCIPPYNGQDVDSELIGEAAAYCEARRAMLLVDPPGAWGDTQTVIDAMNNTGVGTSSKNAMLFYPRLKRAGSLDTYGPSGAVAGVIARTDTQRGVWKAPAGLDATLTGFSQLSTRLTDAENGELNPLGVNCLRTMPAAGPVIWGARTLQGDDRLASEWKYIPVRRLALYIEESLYRGTKWAVFEPNDEPLWAQLRLNIGSFMQDLFRQGAFQGQSAKDAYFVQCDSTTTTQDNIDQGIVNIYVGFAPLKPAEFVILYIQQIAGQLAV